MARVYLLLLCLFAPLSTFLLSSCTARELSLSEFDTLNLKERKYLFIFFYTGEGCEECYKLMFTWQLLEKRILSYPESKLVIGEVDCQHQKELCMREQVTGIPTMKLYTALDDAAQLEFTYDQPETDLISLEAFLRTKLPNSVIEGDNENSNGAFQLKETDYDEEDGTFRLGGKKKSKVVQYVLKGFYELSDEDFALFLGSKGEHLVYFYTPWCKTCRRLEAQWEVALQSLELRTIRLSRINCAHYLYACKYYLVEDYPTLLWISDGTIRQRLKSFSHLSLRQFLNTVERLVAVIESPQLQEKYLLNLNKEDFQSTIGQGTFFVHFTVPWSRHCANMETELGNVLEKSQAERLRIAKVDCSVNEKLCDNESIDGYPTLYLYQNGQRLGEYEGARTTESFLTFLEQFAPLTTKHEEL